MFCGFGAVVLLVLILNTDTVKARNETFADLSADVIRLEQEVINLHHSSALKHRRRTNKLLLAALVMAPRCHR